MGASGVGDDSHVVLLRPRGVHGAARIWWMPRGFGFADAPTRDGGVLKIALHP
ncbi:MAG TPA: hypothetical protein PKD75_11650 [Tepidiformaceae bacterium]|jgi:3-mercaptopyruvate sulfurtransferase SseA|nr:hypothetical protein [Tepidiformaceae bacterium]